MNELLKSTEITQEDLALWLGTSRQTVINYKKSFWMDLKLTQVDTIAKKLKVKTKDLVDLIIRDFKRNNKK